MKSLSQVKMNPRMWSVIGVACASLGITSMSFSQDIMQEALNRAAQMHQGQIALTNQYAQQAGPELQQKYIEYNKMYPNTMTFSEFAYWNMLSGGGANPGAVRQLQQNSYNALQGSHAGIAGAYDAQNLGWQQSQDILGNIYQNQQYGTMGTWPYQNPYGGSYTLPYSYGPNTYYYGNQPIYQNPSGGYVMPTPSYNYPLYPSQ